MTSHARSFLAHDNNTRSSPVGVLNGKKGGCDCAKTPGLEDADLQTSYPTDNPIARGDTIDRGNKHAHETVISSGSEHADVFTGIVRKPKQKQTSGSGLNDVVAVSADDTRFFGEPLAAHGG